MSELTLVIGSPRKSSWSMRPYLALRQIGVPFELRSIALKTPDTASEILRYSPSGRVPALHHGDLVLWDSLAICEYLAERYPAAKLWPEALTARATARCLVAEMHAGFTELRATLPFDIGRTHPTPTLTPGLREEIDRIQRSWLNVRKRFGDEGPFLFGSFTLADAFYAPVVSRFRTYGIPLEGELRTYSDVVWGLPAVQDWLKLANDDLSR